MSERFMIVSNNDCTEYVIPVDKFADFLIQHLEFGNQIEPWWMEMKMLQKKILLPKCKAAPKQVCHAQNEAHSHT